MKNKILLLLFLNFIWLVSCQVAENKVIQDQISDIQKKYINDTRLEYWDVSVENGESNQILSGEVVSENAYLELEKLAGQNNMKMQVELLPQQEYFDNPWGLVTLSVCNIRAEDKHSAELVTQALLGTPVKIYKEENGWYLIQTPDRYFGWVDGAAITHQTNDEIKEWKGLPKVIFSATFGSALEKPGLDGKIVADLVMGNLLSVSDQTFDFLQILFPDGRKAFVNKTDCISTEKWFAKKQNASDVLNTAAKFKGIPYLWGGTSPKMFDCSGFTKTVYFLNGMVLQRDASQQTLYGEEVNTTENYEQLQPGDLLFFGRKATLNQTERVTHVGLYLGNLRFMHASGKVRINSLDKTAEDYTEYYEQAFVRARRVINKADEQGIEWIVDNEFYKMVLPETQIR